MANEEKVFIELPEHYKNDNNLSHQMKSYKLFEILCNLMFTGKEVFVQYLDNYNADLVTDFFNIHSMRGYSERILSENVKFFYYV